jgi:hypothetical protein
MLRISTHIINIKKAAKPLAAAISALMLSAAIFAGCAAPVSSAASEAPSATPVRTTPPDETPAGNSLSAELGEDSNAITHDGWIYYLDINDPVVTDFNEDPPVRMRNTDGSEDKQLGIRGFQFDVIGDYIYVDSNDHDIDAGGAQTWSTTRLNFDGTDMMRLEYGSMSKRLVPEGEQKFYFTTMGDSAVYISDFACENVETLIVNLPDKAEIDSKLGAEKTLQLNISEVTSAAINFDATFSNADGVQVYSGEYSITKDGAAVQKIKGTYYSYSSQTEGD